MKVTQSKKTGLYSFTQLQKTDLIKFHNIMDDVATKYQIRLALLELMPAEERVKYQSQEAIETYWESEGLLLKASSQSSNGFANGTVTSPIFPATPVQDSSDEDTEEEELDEDSEELDELPL